MRGKAKPVTIKVMIKAKQSLGWRLSTFSITLSKG
jgi:hypothetical protein